MNNIEEAKKEVELYRSITKQDIIDIYNKYSLEPYYDCFEYISGSAIIHKLTGFNAAVTCKMCQSIINSKDGIPYCSCCIYNLVSKSDSKQMVCINQPTYKAIFRADNVDMLLDAISHRADYIESLIEIIAKLCE